MTLGIQHTPAWLTDVGWEAVQGLAPTLGIQRRRAWLTDVGWEAMRQASARNRLDEARGGARQRKASGTGQARTANFCDRPARSFRVSGLGFRVRQHRVLAS